MTFDELLGELKTCGVPVAAPAWAETPKGDYATLSYRAFDPLFADDAMVNITQEATVRLYSPGSGEESAKLIQQKLGSLDLTWWLETVDYDEDQRKSIWIWAMLL